MKVLRYIIDKNDVVLDVGANRGLYSYALWRLRTHLHIFEPNLSLFNILLSWGQDKKNVYIYNIGLSDYEGESLLNIPLDCNGIEHDASASLNQNFNSSFSVITQTVNLKKLNSFYFDKIDFIKIDVEGHELQVINGANNLITKFKPILLVEIEQRHNFENINVIFKKIIDFGYTGFFIHRNKVINLFNFDVNLHQNINNFNLSRLYINNFIFISNLDEIKLNKMNNLSLD